MSPDFQPEQLEDKSFCLRSKGRWWEEQIWREVQMFLLDVLNQDHLSVVHEKMLHMQLDRQRMMGDVQSGDAALEVENIYGI